MNTHFNKRKKIGIFLFFLAALFLLPYIVMLLWNNILPAVIGVKTITYLQAIGIFILSKILFGGFNFGGKHRHHKMMKEHFQEKFMNMSNEERETFKQKWRERCGRNC